MKLKQYFRDFRTNHVSNLVSLAGLSIGMMVTIYSVTYIIYESSYDRFHKDSDRIYQISTRMELQPDNEVVMSLTHQQLKEYIDNHIPGIEATCRIRKSSEPIYTGEQKFKNNTGLFIDEEFFSVFDFKMLVGDDSHISDPNTIILCKQLAEKLFGNTDCLGKILTIKGEVYSVIGITDNPPGNSSMQFDYLIPLTNFFRTLPDTYNFLSVETYIKAIHTYESFDDIRSLIGDFYYDYDIKSKEMYSVELMKFTEIHQYYNKTSNNFILFITISVLVLIVSIVNYVNTFAANNELRIRETGIRKVFGASRPVLIRSMLLKSVLMTFLAAILGLILSEIFIDAFRELSGINVSQYGPGLWWIQVLIFIIALLTGILAGIFPALRYSSPDIIGMIRGSSQSMGGSITLRKILVVFQYIISAGLLISIFIFFFQLRYLDEKDPGYEPENRILIGVSPALEFKYNAYIEELRKIPGIISISGNGSGFGETVGMSIRDRDTGEGIPVMGYFVEDDFFKAYGIDLLQGRSFSQTTGIDTESVIIDVATVDILGLDDPIGKSIYTGSLQEVEIIGVVENADLIARKGERKPFLYTQFYNICAELIIHYNGDPSFIAKEVADRMIEFDPEFEYNYRHLAEARNTLYRKEANQAKIVLIAGIVAVILSLIGAYSMVSYLTERRAKQISIRKVMGATVNEVIQLSAKEMLLMIMFAFIVASPVAYLIGYKWLQNFSQKISISPLPFILAMVILTALVFITIFFKERQSAMVNPIDNLRQE